jgi:hypothetical protein
MPVSSLFAGRCNEKCDIINDIRMANKNENVQMYIQTMREFRKSSPSIRTYLAEHFEFKSSYAEKTFSVRFIFVTKEAMSHDIQILSTKFLAGPKMFHNCVNNLASHEVLANYILKKGGFVKEISNNQLDHIVRN